MRRRVTAILVAVVGCAALAGCADDVSGQTLTPAQRLARAKQVLDRAASVQFVLSVDHLPEGIPGLLEATGVGTHDPAFQGEVQAAQEGITVNAEVVAVGGEVYAKFSFSPIFIHIDPADYGAPDPATLMDTERGLSSLLTAATGLRDTGSTRDGDQVLTSIAGRIPGRRVAAIFPTADGGKPFTATFKVDDAAQLREVEMTGPFYRGRPAVSYTVSLDSYGEQVEISPP